MKQAKQERLDELLRFIVEDFTRTSEPVGSENLIRDHRLTYSSATVRNDMAILEREGYIEKRHTSSGRVPSTKGLQYYLVRLKEDPLEEGGFATDGFEKEFAMVFRSKAQSFEDMISKSCEVLSQLTSLATVSLGNQAGNENLTSVTMTPLSRNAATVILLTDRGHVESKTFPVSKESDMEALSTGIRLLNARLNGTPVGEIEEKLRAIEPILKAQIGKDSQIVMEAFAEAFVSFVKKRNQTYGVSKLLSNPNYENDRKSVVEAIRILEGKVKLEGSALSGDEDSGTNVRLAEAANVAVVSQKVDVPGLPQTEVAVVGPKGMDYRKVIGALRYLSDNINRYFRGEEQEEGREDGVGEKTVGKPDWKGG